MAELEQKLNAILNDPETMGQIVSIAQSLTGNRGQEPSPAPPEGYLPVEGDPPSGDETAPQAGAELGALSALLSGGGENDLSSLFGELDPTVLKTAMELFSEYGTNDDKRGALLAALKPFLKEDRQADLDKAIQIARLSRVIRIAFRLFKKEVGKEDV